MGTSYKHLGGVGINAEYRVYRDGKAVAFITRHGRHWKIVSHYSRVLGGGGTSEQAKQWCNAQESFPTKQDVYDTICAEVEKRRRGFLEQQSAKRLAQLGRDVLAFSNSALGDMALLLMEIETLAKDRVKSTKPPERPYPSRESGKPYDPEEARAWRDDQCERFQGQPITWPSTWGGTCDYPKPPEPVEPVQEKEGHHA